MTIGIMERMKITLDGGLDSWPTESVEYEYREAIKEIERQAAQIEGLNGRFAKDQDRIACQAEQLAAQAAQIERLRDVVKRAAVHIRPTCYELFDILTNALSTTSDQALEQFAERVREHCLAAVANQKYSDACSKEDRDWNRGVGAALVAIRSIK